MIDWHTHILPGMDDGSHDVEESIAMINMQMSQGVSMVIATPHFYANDESVESFLDRRKKTLAILEAKLPKDAPAIRLGAEVKYYPGISRMADLKALRIEGSKLLLLEMPMSSWTENMIRELLEMSSRSDTRVVLAHVERYMGMQKRTTWKRLQDNGILMQVNASYVTSFLSKYKAISLLKKGNIHFIGSDCHNLALRPPQIGKAFEIIRNKFGDEYIGQMNEFGYSLLAKSK